ncbi:hypothetical protein HDV05_007596 [Chytridiales sp. JEL 0842]|nr:hypothetical protein HDV05_007596 [Chytridiales sp. JEL 0842]
MHLVLLNRRAQIDKRVQQEAMAALEAADAETTGGPLGKRRAKSLGDLRYSRPPGQGVVGSWNTSDGPRFVLEGLRVRVLPPLSPSEKPVEKANVGSASSKATVGGLVHAGGVPYTDDETGRQGTFFESEELIVYPSSGEEDDDEEEEEEEEANAGESSEEGNSSSGSGSEDKDEFLWIKTHVEKLNTSILGPRAMDPAQAKMEKIQEMYELLHLRSENWISVREEEAPMDATTAAAAGEVARQPQPTDSWRLLHRSASTTSNLSHGALVALDSLRVNPATSTSPASIAGFILVRNVCFEKHIRVRYTIDNWAAYTEVEASFVGSVSQTMGGFVGVDRFGFEIPLVQSTVHVGTEAARKVSALRSRIDAFDSNNKSSINGYSSSNAGSQGSLENPTLLFEFAIKANLNGAEHWDNNNNHNHFAILRSLPKRKSVHHPSPQVSMAALEAAKREARALRGEVEELQREFWASWKCEERVRRRVERDVEELRDRLKGNVSPVVKVGANGEEQKAERVEEKKKLEDVEAAVVAKASVVSSANSTRVLSGGMVGAAVAATINRPPSFESSPTSFSKPLQTLTAELHQVRPSFTLSKKPAVQPPTLPHQPKPISAASSLGLRPATSTSSLSLPLESIPPGTGLAGSYAPAVAHQAMAHPYNAPSSQYNPYNPYKPHHLHHHHYHSSHSPAHSATGASPNSPKTGSPGKHSSYGPDVQRLRAMSLDSVVSASPPLISSNSGPSPTYPPTGNYPYGGGGYHYYGHYLPSTYATSNALYQNTSSYSPLTAPLSGSPPGSYFAGFMNHLNPHHHTAGSSRYGIPTAFAGSSYISSASSLGSAASMSSQASPSGTSDESSTGATSREQTYINPSAIRPPGTSMSRSSSQSSMLSNASVGSLSRGASGGGGEGLVAGSMDAMTKLHIQNATSSLPTPEEEKLESEAFSGSVGSSNSESGSSLMSVEAAAKSGGTGNVNWWPNANAQTRGRDSNGTHHTGNSFFDDLEDFASPPPSPPPFPPVIGHMMVPNSAFLLSKGMVPVGVGAGKGPMVPTNLEDVVGGCVGVDKIGLEKSTVGVESVGR